MKISIRLIKSRIPLILTPTIPKTMPAMALPIGRERLLKAIATMPQAMDIAAPMHLEVKRKKKLSMILHLLMLKRFLLSWNQ